MTLLILAVSFALGVSCLCSLLEAALLSARLAALAARAAAGSRGAGMLLEMKQHRIDDAISAILILNTVSNTLGATLAGAQAARVFGQAWVGVFSGVLTFLILVLAEIVPKTLGAAYALPLSGFVGRALRVLTLFMTPVLVFSRAVTRLLTSKQDASLSRGELGAVIDRAAAEGSLSSEESKLLANMLKLDEVKVHDVMTPRTVMVTMSCTDTLADFMVNREAQVHSRIPLWRDERDNVVGYFLQREVLRAAAEGRDPSRKLYKFLRPIHFVPEMATTAQALRLFLHRREPIAMVTDEHGGVEGLVTLEDLTETLLGVEILDESDQVADLREVAIKRREERLARMRQKYPAG